VCRRHLIIAELVAAAARTHATRAVGTFADGEATFYGPDADETSLFEIGSISKPFTGVLLADMSLRGEVNLDDAITTYLPDTTLPRWKGRPPTLEELATHRAALPNAPRALARKELAFGLGLSREDPWADIDAARYHTLTHATAAAAPPGRRFAYSSLGYGLLGDAGCSWNESPPRSGCRASRPRRTTRGSCTETRNADNRGRHSATRCPRPARSAPPLRIS
jgi:CubicO group peptidase (beta-lactamase class C family)